MQAHSGASKRKAPFRPASLQGALPESHCPSEKSQNTLGSEHDPRVVSKSISWKPGSSSYRIDTLDTPWGLFGGRSAALWGEHVVQVVGKGRQDEGHHGASQRANDGVDQPIEGERDRDEPQQQRCATETHQILVSGVQSTAIGGPSKSQGEPVL